MSTKDLVKRKEHLPGNPHTHAETNTHLAALTHTLTTISCAQKFFDFI